MTAFFPVFLAREANPDHIFTGCLYGFGFWQQELCLHAKNRQR
jgi:hypothetical protein